MKTDLAAVLLSVPLAAWSMCPTPMPSPPELKAALVAGPYPVVKGVFAVPDGTYLTALLRSPWQHAGTTAVATVSKSTFQTPVITLDDGRPLPSGRYIVSIVVAELQPEPIQCALDWSKSPRWTHQYRFYPGTAYIEPSISESEPDRVAMPIQ